MKRIAHIENGYISNVSLANDSYQLPTDGSQILEEEAIANNIPYASIPITRRWSNVQEFMAAFTMQEKAAISLSSDATIAALRLELSSWFSEVHLDDDRVKTGLSRLVELDIISEARRQQIIDTAS